MPTRTAVVGSAVGLHARPAQIIADAVAGLGVDVFIGRPGQTPVDASSALMIMTLGAGNGATVELTSGEAGAVETIAALVEKDLEDH
ncbi:HPr family phosphocarrier protein [Streptomyces sp. YIM S03343]